MEFNSDVVSEDRLAKVPLPFILVFDKLICGIDQERLETIFVKNFQHQKFLRHL
jgi:hypothetical protein